jgi:hypothetical protein
MVVVLSFLTHHEKASLAFKWIYIDAGIAFVLDFFVFKYEFNLVYIIPLALIVIASIILIILKMKSG